MLSFALAALLSQAEVQGPDRAAEAAERAARSAERAAVAAQKAAEALQKIAELQAAAAAAAPPVVPTAPAEAKKDEWTGLVGIGLIALTGNSETLTGTAAAQADKKLGNWAIGFRAGGAYGQTRLPTGEDQVTALRALFTARVDRSIASFATLYALAGLETDHVKSVELRGYGELGSGIIFYEKKEPDFERSYLRGDVAFRVSHESRFQYFGDANFAANTGLPDATMVGPRVGAVFRYALNKELRFSEEAEILPNLVGEARYLINSTTKLNAHLTRALSITASFLINFDSAPAGGKKTTDTALTLGVEAAF